MATTKAITANAVKNNGGTIFNAGNVNTSTSAITNNFTLVEANQQPLVYGTKVSLATGTAGSSGNVGTGKGISTGTLAYLQAREYQIRGFSTKINGTASNVVKFASSDYWRRPIYFLETTRRLDEDSWNAVTGAVTKGGSQGASVAFGEDHAARPTDAVPGELVYMYGAKNPLQDDFAAKNPA